MKVYSSGHCGSAIAIVGMACRYPGNVNSPKQFLQFLLNGGNGIIEVPPDRWDIQSYYDPDKSKPNRMYVKRGGFLDNVDMFDPLFFGISPKEAPHIDPQHRWLLEITQEALENAGIRPSSIRGSDTAVYIGQFMHDYEQILLDANAHKNMTSHTATGPSMTLTANRISYLFDLTGPSVTLDTACSSSLVALDLACKAILNGDSRMAIAGGVNILLRPELTMSICAASMLSPDGYCKSFDESANGYVRSEGAGVVVIKPLRDAIEQGDPVLAVIKATAVNQDGQTLGITVPNGESQKKLLTASFKKAGVSPEDIQYAEAHGTGTAVGDPIEVNALGSLLGQRNGQDCIVGSVKSNVGHMESAAGMAGLMKTVLAMREGIIPGNLHFKKINPAIDLKQLHLKIADRAKPWPDTQGKPRRALVNSFGFGGTNSNVILEEAPIVAEPSVPSQKPVINNGRKMLPISAKSDKALGDLVESYIGFFRDIADDHAIDSDKLLHDICYTASLRRDHYKHRLVVAANNVAEFIDSLAGWREGKMLPNVWSGTERANPGGKICFVFSGMGTQWAGVGRELYDNEPIFRQELDRCDQALTPLTGWSLVEAIYGSENKDAIHSTHIAQPVIFAVQVALAKLFESWGVSPDFIVGHSAGEVAASYIGGALNFDDAIQVIYHRSRLQHTTEGTGKMLAVGLSETDLAEYLRGWEAKVSTGAINSEDAITLSGDAEALEAIAARLDENGVFARFLKVNVPYHSPVMDRLRPELESVLRDIRPQAPRLSLFSTVSAGETREGDWSAEYWFRNVREPVNFKGAIENIARSGVSAFVEIAPHAALASSIKSTVASRKPQPAIIPTLRREQDAINNVYEAIAQLHIHNILSPWEVLYPQKGQVETLPNYAWQRSSYWWETEEVRQARLKNTGFLGAFEEARFPLLGGKLSSGHWLWQTQLDLGEFSYFRGHKVGNDIVYPGAGYIEMALSMAASLDETNRVQSDHNYFALESIKFHRALYLDHDKSQVIESSYDPTTKQFSISVPDGTAADWVVHASGVIRDNQRKSPEKQLDLSAIQADMTERRDRENFYEHCRKLGLEYESQFVAINSIHVAGDKALAEINVSEQILGEQKDYFLHPVILDAAFQTFFATVELGYLPAGIQAIRHYRKPTGKCYSYYETLEASPARVLGNITLCDESGDVLTEIFGIEVLAIQRKVLAGADNKTLTYDFDWMEQSLATEQTTDNGLWMIVADRGDLWQSVKTELEARKQKVCLVKFGETFAKDTDSSFAVPPGSPQDLETVFRERSGLLKGVIYLHDVEPIAGPAMENMTAEQLCATCENNALAAVNFTRAVASVEFQLTQKIMFVSQDTQAVLSGEDNSSQLTAAGIWGFARVLANEHPEFQVSLVDLPAEESPQNISLLVSDLLSTSNEQEIAYRNGVRYVHRLERLGESRFRKYTHATYCFTAREPFQAVRTEVDGLSWRFQRLDTPEPQDNNVLIASEYSAILTNPAGGENECYIVIARVVKKGSLAKKFTKQDAVIYLSSEPPRSHYCVHENHLVALPAQADPAKMALSAAPHLLANYIFKQRLNLSPNSAVLIHQAGTPFGQIALGLAKTLGIQPFATVENNAERARLVSLGYANVFNCESYADLRELKKAMPAGRFDAVVSGWHGGLPTQVEELVGDFGHLVTLVSANRETSDARIPYAKAANFSQHAISTAKFLDTVIRQIEAGHTPIFDDIDLRLLAVSEPCRVSAEEFLRAENTDMLALDYAITPDTGIEGVAETYIRPDRTYLITGGLGGLGQQIMNWLTDNGAKSIALVGRRQPSNENLRGIEQVRSAGIRVEVMQGDVANLDDVQRIVSTIQSSLLPLGGVIHSAGVLEDGVIVQQNAEKIHKVLAPKVKGAWNLHLATRHLSLDMFICFSSIASIIGWAGQSNYAYANAFMDALAFYRRSRGLSALTINWGPWADAGMAANLSERDKHRMNQAGMFPLPADQGLAGMAALLSHRVIQAGVFDIDWNLISRQYPNPERKTLLKDLIKIGENTSQQNFLESFLKASPDVRESLLAKMVGKILAGVLGLDSAEAIDVDGNVFDYGVNSLMAMELKNGIQNLVKQKLPTSLIMANPSVRKIVAYIMQLDFSSAANGKQGMDDEAYTGLVPLTAEQKNFLSWLKINPQWAITNHYFETDSGYDVDKLNQAVNHVCRRHDSLRARFYQTDNGWAQNLVPHQDYQAVVELDWRATKSKTELLPALKDYAQEKSLAHQLDSDPLIRITVVYYGDEGKMLILFSLHHFALDGYSIHILTEDILTAYQQLLEEKPVSLPPQTTPVRDWIASLTRLAGSDELTREMTYWKSLPLEEACSTPVDRPENLDKRYIKTHARHKSELSRELSIKIMRDLPKARNIPSFDIFLTAFVVAVSEWKDSSAVAFGAVDNGRSLLSGNEEIDLSRTIGWLSILKVIFINRPADCSLAELVEYVRQQFDALPNGGANLELISAYHENASVRAEMLSLPRPKIWINYSGNPLRNDKLGVRELEGYNWVNWENQLPWHFLVSVNEVNSIVHVFWDYSIAVHDDTTVDTLARRFNRALTEIVAALEATPIQPEENKSNRELSV